MHSVLLMCTTYMNKDVVFPRSDKQVFLHEFGSAGVSCRSGHETTAGRLRRSDSAECPLGVRASWVVMATGSEVGMSVAEGFFSLPFSPPPPHLLLPCGCDLVFMYELSDCVSITLVHMCVCL